MAQAFRRFGSRVTIVERGPHIAPLEDPDVAAEIAQIFKNDSIDVLTSAETRNVQGRSGERVALTVRTPAGDERLVGTDILVGAGRTPNTAGIGLDKLGVELDERGFVKVNERLETTAPDVWGIGESCSGNPQFTHVSHDDSRIISDNLAGGHRSRNDRVVPYCMFTDPPLAHIGLNEGQAKQRGSLVSPKAAVAS
jgi:pyruvate/2-oxoglutarate dehydrogenase complex dihydrolipoamide dehydrogenase (E3) component